MVAETTRAPEPSSGGAQRIRVRRTPKGKAGPESGGLSRTVETFSHNQTKTELHRAAKKKQEMEGERLEVKTWKNTSERMHDYKTI